MKLSIFLVLFYISFISCDNYAVLVAGSNTYINYRHQADVFHHYQILIDRGFMPENIIKPININNAPKVSHLAAT